MRHPHGQRGVHVAARRDAVPSSRDPPGGAATRRWPPVSLAVASASSSSARRTSASVRPDELARHVARDLERGVDGRRRRVGEGPLRGRGRYPRVGAGPLRGAPRGRSIRVAGSFRHGGGRIAPGLGQSRDAAGGESRAALDSIPPAQEAPPDRHRRARLGQHRPIVGGLLIVVSRARLRGRRADSPGPEARRQAREPHPGQRRPVARGGARQHLERVAGPSATSTWSSAGPPSLERDVQGSFGRIGLVRFNPFEDTGGNQSFALALLDGRGDGFVVSSLHARDFRHAICDGAPLPDGVRITYAPRIQLGLAAVHRQQTPYADAFSWRAPSPPDH